jgi:hypothetical protein
MDADDVMHPLRLQEDVALLRSTTAAAVTSRVKVLPHRSTLMRGYVGWQNAVVSASDHQREAWIEQPFCNPATTYRRRALDAVGGWRARAWPEDYDLFLRFVRAGFDVIKRPLVRHAWRQHLGQITRTVQATQTRDALAACKAHHLVPCFDLTKKRVVVVGAGKEGRRISRALRAEGVVVAAFVDVDPKKIGKTVHGVLVGSSIEGADFVVGAVGTSGARGAVRGFVAGEGFVEGEDFVVVA